jgi:signal transduction histidine kinase/CheY-like chemotaxis protein
MWWLLVAALAVAGWWFNLHVKHGHDSPHVHWQTLQRALLRTSAPGTFALNHAEPVTLPDSWAAHGLPRTGVGRYTATFTLDAAGAHDSDSQPWALRINDISYVHVVWLNGHLLRNTVSRPDWLGDPAPLLVDIPGGLLQPGTNTLVIDVHASQQGGLSKMWLGERASLVRGHTFYEALTRFAPVLLNLLCATFSLFVVLLWWLRRGEMAAGLFGLIFLVATVRNCAYIVTVDLNLPAGLTSWLYFMAHTVAACAQGWFVMAITDRHRPWFHRLLQIVMIGFPLISLSALPWDPDLKFTRDLLQPILIAIFPPSIWLLWTGRSRLSPTALRSLLIGWVTILIAGVHDFTWIRLFGDVTQPKWMIWATPLAATAFAVMVLARVVQAFNEIEQLNVNLEQKVDERTRELATANAAKSRFLASASHDLRQPVAAIGLLTDLLRHRLIEPAHRELTDRLSRAVASLESLLAGLLDLSRLDAGTVDVHRSAVPLQPMLDAIADHEGPNARHKGIRLRVRRTNAVAWSDPVLLEQILRNLIGNAVRYTREGGVLVGVRRHGADLRLDIWDTGRGISQADQARVFDEFVQVGNPGRDRNQGLGLGLAIVRRAMRLLGHELRLRSVPDQGSCFSIILPATRAPAPPEATSPTGAATPSTEGAPLPPRAWRVLLVEDELAIRHALTQMLDRWGMQVEAGPGLAWARSRAGQDWDMVISDHRLSDGSGRAVVDAVRAAHPGLPALIITGDSAPEQLEELADSGVPVLHKPFRAEKLRAMIEETMARA